MAALALLKERARQAKLQLEIVGRQGQRVSVLLLRFRPEPILQERVGEVTAKRYVVGRQADGLTQRLELVHGVTDLCQRDDARVSTLVTNARCRCVRALATFSAHTASPPLQSRTPAGSRASSRRASIAPRTMSAHDPLSSGAPRCRTHRSVRAPPAPAGASRLP